jgi:hypothetical protein
MSDFIEQRLIEAGEAGWLFPCAPAWALQAGWASAAAPRADASRLRSAGRGSWHAKPPAGSSGKEPSLSWLCPAWSGICVLRSVCGSGLRQGLAVLHPGRVLVGAGLLQPARAALDGRNCGVT